MCQCFKVTLRTDDLDPQFYQWYYEDNCLHQAPLLIPQGSMKKMGWKDCPSQRGWMTQRKWCILDTTWLMQYEFRLWHHIHWSKLDGTQPWEGGSGHWFTPLTKNLPPIDSSLQKKELVFPNRVSLDIYTTLNGGPMHKVDDQYKMNSVFYLEIFLSHIALFWAVCLPYRSLFVHCLQFSVFIHLSMCSACIFIDLFVCFVFEFFFACFLSRAKARRFGRVLSWCPGRIEWGETRIRKCFMKMIILK